MIFLRLLGVKHIANLIHLSCMPEGLVPPERRIADIKRRRSIEGIDHDAEYPRFRERKEALALREERELLSALAGAASAFPTAPARATCSLVRCGKSEARRSSNGTTPLRRDNEAAP